MIDVGRWLRDADPLAGDAAPGLSPSDAQAIRGAMLTAHDARTTAPPRWPHPLVIAATIALTLAAGAVVGRHLPRAGETRDAAVRAPAGEPRLAAARRQLQFATPGGTRVIWVFDPDFEP